jgi:DNA-directed RNA polymerase specialized sigma24 family protein
MTASIDDLWPAVRAVAERGESAWPALAAALFPLLLPIAARQPIGRLRANEDTPHEIVTRVLENLHAREFAALVKLCATAPQPALGAWLRVVVRRAAIDYMRESPEYERATARRDPRWISLATLTSSAPDRGPDSLVEKRTTLISFLRAAVARADAETRDHGDDALARLASEWDVPRIHVRRLVQRGAQYLKVIDAVLAGHSYPEVADALGISRREVELTVFYIEELLTARRFAQ